MDKSDRTVLPFSCPCVCTDEANCAEFCRQSHNFRLRTIGGDVSEAGGSLDLSVTFDQAGTDFGCVQQVSDGVTANQVRCLFSHRLDTVVILS